MKSKQSNHFSKFDFLALLIIISLVFLTSLNLNLYKNVMNEGNHEQIIKSSQISILSWKPRIFLYKKFLTYKECNHLIELVKNNLEELHVTTIEEDTIDNNFQKYSQAWIPKNYDVVIIQIENRISIWTMLPPAHGEQLQVSKYEVGMNLSSTMIIYLMVKIVNEVVFVL